VKIVFVKPPSNSSFINLGEIPFPSGLKSPVFYEVYVEKFIRGNWHKEILDRKGDDFCLTIQSPSEPWFALTSMFTQKTCPFQAGHVEKFDHVKIGNAPVYLPYIMIGKYRCTMKFTSVQSNGRNHTDCSTLKFEVVDV
jgi:hypothetical protein